jgi:hypothetical protein
MKLTTDVEDAIDAIRDQICEEIKDMTPSEHVAYFNSHGEELAKEFHFKVAKSASDVHKAELVY